MASLITGGTGFIGAEIVRMLLDQGDERPVIFCRNPENNKRLADIADRVDWVAGDLGNFSHVLHAVEQARPRVIYHLGAMLSITAESDPSGAIQDNALGTFHVLEAARLFNVSQICFASSMGVYGFDIQESVIDDYTLERPQLLYGVTKVFGEHLGLFYKRRYGIDFRGVRYPGIVGPGRGVGGATVYPSWVIEECAKGRPFTIRVEPETRLPIMYFKDAARALIDLMEPDEGTIKMTNYILDGVTPTPSAGEIADMVRSKVPGAQVDFQVDPQIQTIIDGVSRPIDHRTAQNEWGWKPQYDLEHMVDDFLQELSLYPQRYD